MTNSRRISERSLPVRRTGDGARAGSIRAALALVVLVGTAVAVPFALFFDKGERSVTSLLFGERGSEIAEGETCLVKKGDLAITVSESGSLQAERMERIRSKVPQSVSIIELIPEGTEISAADVQAGRVLVKLDSSSLEERLTKQEITVESVEAAYTRAKENYLIQERQNESNIRAAELDVKFSRMELEHYLGTALATGATEETDFARLRESQDLGGAARQKKTALETDVQLTQEELERAIDTYEWTKQLSDKQYVSRNELKADELARMRRDAELEQAKLSLELFARYELPKEAETRFADRREKVLELDRVKAKANAQMAQELANVKSSEATYTLEKQQLGDLEEQVGYCTIRATQPGLVVYASSTDFWRRSRSPIEEGASMRERQEIIHLPDLSSMIAEVKVHESVVKKVKKGQAAVVTVDAYPDLRLTGTVKEVAGLPDPQNWMQDVKVFNTTIVIEGEHPYLRPGMSCRGEITIAELPQVLYVPVQAVTTRGDRRVCFAVEEGNSRMSFVETGEFDDKFVEIRSGLAEGQRVLLAPPFLPVEEEAALAEGEGEPPASEAAEGSEERVEQPADAEEPEAEPAGAADREAMMQKMEELGVTTADLQRWRSGDVQPEEQEKLKALGITQEALTARPPGRRTREGADEHR